MKIYDDLTKIFSDNWFHRKYHGGIFEIEGEGKQATVKKVELEYHGQLMSIDNAILTKTDFLFPTDENTISGMPKLQHGCDGVLIIEQKEQKYIVFIELKSDYTKENIRKAERQLCASYLHVMVLLNCLNDFDLHQYKKCGIIISHPIDKETITRIQKTSNVNKKLTRYEKQCLAFASSKPKNFPISKTYSLLGKLPIKDCLCFDTLPTFHFNINQEASSGRFNLNEVLDKL